jgi:hypothetical protein
MIISILTFLLYLYLAFIIINLFISIIVIRNLFKEDKVGNNNVFIFIFTILIVVSLFGAITTRILWKMR